MTLKVVELDPDSNPVIGSLTERLKNVVYDAVKDQNITFAEVVGVIDMVKHDFIMEATKD